MTKKFTEILCLIVVLTLSLTACNPAEVEQITTETIPAEEEKTEEIIETEVVQVEEIKATRTTRPTTTPKPPEFFQDTGFPIGKFTSDSSSAILYFQADGSCVWESIPGYTQSCRYGVNGDLFIHTLYSAGQPKIPATYYWEFDGSHLKFHLYGIDLRENRMRALNDKTYTYLGPSFYNTEVIEQTFPTGRFVSLDGARAFEFDEDGLWRFFDGDLENPVLSGKYAISGDTYTEMTHDNPDEQQVPVTYYWTFDGENLTFTLWGDEMIPYREGMYNGQTYIWVEE